jgi:hypothetical protein
MPTDTRKFPLQGKNRKRSADGQNGAFDPVNSRSVPPFEANQTHSEYRN